MNRRDFMKLGFGALLLPYVPKVVYSFPSAIVPVSFAELLAPDLRRIYVDTVLYEGRFEVTYPMWVGLLR